MPKMQQKHACMEFDVSSYFSIQKICLKHGKLHLITGILQKMQANSNLE